MDAWVKRTPAVKVKAEESSQEDECKAKKPKTN